MSLYFTATNVVIMVKAVRRRRPVRVERTSQEEDVEVRQSVDEYSIRR